MLSNCGCTVGTRGLGPHLEGVVDPDPQGGLEQPVHLRVDSGIAHLLPRLPCKVTVLMRYPHAGLQAGSHVRLPSRFV